MSTTTETVLSDVVGRLFVSDDLYLALPDERHRVPDHPHGYICGNREGSCVGLSAGEAQILRHIRDTAGLPELRFDLSTQTYVTAT